MAPEIQLRERESLSSYILFSLKKIYKITGNKSFIRIKISVIEAPGDHHQQMSLTFDRNVFKSKSMSEMLLWGKCEELQRLAINPNFTDQ